MQGKLRRNSSAFCLCLLLILDWDEVLHHLIRVAVTGNLRWSHFVIFQSSAGSAHTIRRGTCHHLKFKWMEQFTIDKIHPKNKTFLKLPSKWNRWRSIHFYPKKSSFLKLSCVASRHALKSIEWRRQDSVLHIKIVVGDVKINQSFGLLTWLELTWLEWNSGKETLKSNKFSFC